jgi:two-component system nitrogen regulation response regulator GlnG/two-component system response regulator HydG
VLGRGAALPDDPAQRVTFLRQRPGATQRRTPLSSARVSRQQLHLIPRGDDLEVTVLGRCPLLVHGKEVTTARVGPGDVLVLRNTLVLLVIRRQQELDAPQAWPRERDFPFGAPDPFGMVGESAAIWDLRDTLASVARTRHHVLLRGQSGAGKELAARAVHAFSERAQGALVTRNAATIPDGLIDAELFGNARNYPHAGSPERQGLIGEADGGTLFLDEIGELPERMQAHLLRVLDQGEYQRLGESQVRRSDLRLLAATNRDLDVLKHDFAARFTARIELPGLNERREDIPLLVRHLLGRAAAVDPVLAERLFEQRDGEVAEPRLDPLLIERLLRHPFTHNLRELERLLFQALTESKGRFITVPQDLAEEPRPEGPEPVDAAALDRETIEAALRECQGSTTQAAKKLGLRSRFALYRLMKRFGITTAEG